MPGAARQAELLVRRPVLSLGWVLGSGLAAMGTVAIVAALLPFLPGDATWEISVLPPVAQSTLLLVTGLYVLGAIATVTGVTRVLVAVLVVAALLLALVVVGVITVILDLWLLSAPSRFGQTFVGGLYTLGVRGVLLGVTAVAASGVLSAHFAAAFHTLRARR